MFTFQGNDKCLDKYIRPNLNIIQYIHELKHQNN